MTETVVKVSRAISAYIRLRDEKNRINAEAKKQVKKLEEQMELLLGYLAAEADKHGLQGFRASDGCGEAHFTTKRFVKVPDWEEFIEWVDQHSAWHMLEKRAAKNAVIEYQDHNDGLTPPGLTVEKLRVMEVRR